MCQTVGISKWHATIENCWGLGRHVGGLFLHQCLSQVRHHYYRIIFTVMCFCTFTQSIRVDYLENITNEQEEGEAQCQSAGLKATINYATSFSAIACSNWKLYMPSVWAHTHCQPFLHRHLPEQLSDISQCRWYSTSSDTLNLLYLCKRYIFWKWAAFFYL